jgi:lipoprotein-releasing system ATP-binding protein
MGQNQIDVLKGVTLEVSKGEIVAITGVSGSGKSTLLNLLSGIDRPNSGEVWFREKNIFLFSEKELARFRNREIGFIFQFHHLLRDFSALENTMLPSLIMGVRRDVARSMAYRLFDKVGLSKRKTHKPDELSYGEQQRVAVLRALINNPKLVFADEPTGNLDHHTSQEVRELLFSLVKEQGITMIVATHSQEMTKNANRVFRLLDGKLVLESAT